jgi:hypothetical protein
LPIVNCFFFNQAHLPIVNCFFFSVVSKVPK